MWITTTIKATTTTTMRLGTNKTISICQSLGDKNITNVEDPLGKAIVSHSGVFVFCTILAVRKKRKSQKPK